MTTTPPTSPERLDLQARLMTLFTGFRAAYLIASVAELAIADALADGPLTRAQLAERTGSHADSVYRALRALATYGVFQELDDGRLALTPMAELLRSDVSGSLRDYARQLSFDWFREAWGEVTHTLRTGETAFDRTHGMRLFEYLPRHPEASELFSRIMVSRASMEDTVVAQSYDFSASRSVIDVGGGHGRTMVSILAAFPLLHGVVFDLPSVIAGTRDFLNAAGVADRCRAEGGDFFERAPEGGDTYLLSRVIHDWNDDRATAILQSCRQAIPDDGKLLIVEDVIPRGNERHPGKLMDIGMLVMAGGREGTQEEFRSLLQGADFRLTRVVPTHSSVSIIEAVPV